jgi:hypothetical protein
MSPDLIEIVVYDAPAARRSACDCGCDHHGHESDHSHGHGHAHGDAFEKISMEMQTRALAMTMEREFPGKVRVEYITYPTPLVYVNGQGRFAGALSVERLREEVQSLLTAEKV